MKKLQTFSIDIPHPCTQNWDDMTPNCQGRHCDSCMKTVIDFTTWSDAELFNFFANNKGAVCGRYLNTQLRRSIQIPYQPHSRLYRIAIAMGLTLMFVYAPEVRAQSRPPMASDSVVAPDFTKKAGTSLYSDGLAEIRGAVMDDKNEPLVNASVQLLQNGKVIGGTISDFDGIYSIKGLSPGYYEVRVNYVGFTTKSKTIVLLHDSNEVVKTILMPAGKRDVITVGAIYYGPPLIDKYNHSFKFYPKW